MIARLKRAGAPLSQLLAGLAQIDACHERVIAGLSLDSRTTRPGELFLACAGEHGHGARHIPAAHRAGAAAIAIEPGPEAAPPASDGIPHIMVPRLRAAVGVIADRYYGEPSHALRVVGVTGTNGKTSVSHLVAHALNAGETVSRCGVLGTLGHGLPGRLEPALNTTPDPITIHCRLRTMQDAGLEQAVMEVSSHGLTQGRVAGVRFAIAVFTNLSRDHLDYHGTMTAYGAAKKLLFKTPGLRAAVLNLDDAFSGEIQAILSSTTRVLGYSLREQPGRGDDHVLGSLLQLGAGGLRMEVRTPWGEGEIESPLLGRCSAYNLLAALATLLELGLPLAEACRRLNRAGAPPGRLESFAASGRGPRIVVDYAHTPDGLEQVLQAVRPLCEARLYCIFGCGGERDSGKRPLMGALAEAFADVVVVTTDNPRGEDPNAIHTAILRGMRRPERVRIEPDRERAIAWAMTQAGPDDLVLVAGKGHEDYQEIAGVRRPYSDREVVQRLLGEARR